MKIVLDAQEISDAVAAHVVKQYQSGAYEVEVTLSSDGRKLWATCIVTPKEERKSSDGA